MDVDQRPPPILEARRLTVGWGGVPILEDLYLPVERGAVLCVLGGSGTGKSTLLRALIGLDRPMSGEVIMRVEPDPYLPPEAPRLGVLFQSAALFGSMTVLENVALPLRRWTDLDPRAIETIARAKLRLVGLESYENHLPAELSGGMKKRAGIARAIALEAPLLFLDEPSAGLDPVTSAALDDLILTLNRNLGITVVIVTHELQSVYRIGTDCVLLHRDTKGIVARGRPTVLRDKSKDPRVRAFFHAEHSLRSSQSDAQPAQVQP
ncbi:ABC transporter ATP-binding protein [Engelhardtia mirabilis]|uniref:Methionine import ATP-binding protein MetN 2 n=1 Tax=Engelhardtia mirabilis TaxID=2528011 RepID=A0A518BLH4_9BACT|nr:Methionine import ATP-binding protein MetN 2 [Planctomycetes bacterium Pla133]QDV02141.1 Methionine import ATP-binding protein MetN 2 [Planctomycetes bacterium Pla86]